MQIKEPLYSKSIAKWRKYETRLAPFVDRLDAAQTLTDAFFRDVHVLGDAYAPKPPAPAPTKAAPTKEAPTKAAPEAPKKATAPAKRAPPPQKKAPKKETPPPPPAPPVAPPVEAAAVRLVFEGDETDRPAPFAVKLSHGPRRPANPLSGAA